MLKRHIVQPHIERIHIKLNLNAKISAHNIYPHIKMKPFLLTAATGCETHLGANRNYI